MMTGERIREFMHAAPFRPFTLHLADGRRFIVDHPDFISINRNGRTIVVHGQDNSQSTISVIMVTSIETGPDDEELPNATTNGEPQ